MHALTLPLLLLQAAPADEAPAAAPAPPPAPPACVSEGHGQFDFWVGEWEVFSNANGNRVGDSRIERTNNGCAVIENWLPANGATGTSLNSFDARSGTWHQKWVGSSPGAVEFVGGYNEEAMVLTGNWPSPAAPHLLIRMTYTVEEDGAVRQHGEASTDHGVSWQTSFDFLYRPKESE